MAFGIQIFNSHGSVQISDEVPNYALREVVVSANFLTTGPYSSQSLVAFAPTVFASQYSPTLFDNKAYVFSPSTEFSPASSGFGFEVYGASGGLHFTSTRLPLRIVDYVNLDAGTDTEVEFTYVSGRSYAVIPLVENMYESFYTEVTSTDHATNIARKWVFAFKVAGHVVTFKKVSEIFSQYDSEYLTGAEPIVWDPFLMVEVPNIPGSIGTDNNGNEIRMRALVVDVTHAE